MNATPRQARTSPPTLREALGGRQEGAKNPLGHFFAGFCLTGITQADENCAWSRKGRTYEDRRQ